MLIVYSLIGRHTMTDLQEDRSLVRNLLNQGMDLWVIDWGNASRADRYLTIDDYVSGYLDDCVDRDVRRDRRREGQPAGHLRGWGVHPGLRRAGAGPGAEPGADRHPARFPRRSERREAEQGFINVWTRSLTGEDVDRMIEVWGVLPGEFMSAVFSMMTPIRSMTKYNLDLLDVVDNEGQAAELPADGEVAGRPPAPRRGGRQAMAQGPLPGQQVDQQRAGNWAAARST